MKTARQILLERHQDIAPALDRIREQVVEQELRTRREPAPALRTAKDVKEEHALFVRWIFAVGRTLWQELICPAKRVWIGFAATWALLLILNVADQKSSDTQMARSAPPSAGALIAWMDQQKIVADLFLPQWREDRVADRPRRIAPKPRSQCLNTMKMC